jgi:hypothetical protein
VERTVIVTTAVGVSRLMVRGCWPWLPARSLAVTATVAEKVLLELKAYMWLWLVWLTPFRLWL